ncbi:MAG: hypothetical protein GYB65_08895, partial [Chloroflexi bacterium]|nr:hypothetical protein [Chloroflexota bacterium]
MPDIDTIYIVLIGIVLLLLLGGLIALIIFYYRSLMRYMTEIVKHGHVVGGLAAGLTTLLVFMGVGNICCPFMWAPGIVTMIVWRRYKKALAAG